VDRDDDEDQTGRARDPGPSGAKPWSAPVVALASMTSAAGSAWGRAWSTAAMADRLRATAATPAALVTAARRSPSTTSASRRCSARSAGGDVEHRPPP